MAQLHIREWGSGERTAVLVHGLSASSASWEPLAAHLVANGYRVLAPDLAGHGASPGGPYSREKWAADLMDTLPAEPDVALGHSLGGVLLAMIADQLKPKRAIYEDPAWYPWLGDGYGVDQPGIRALKGHTREQITEGNPTWEDDVVAHRLAELEVWDADTTRMAYLETAYVPVFAVVPSLVVLADPSPVMAPPLADHFRDVGFEVRSVQGAGHFVHSDTLDGFLDALDGWI